MAQIDKPSNRAVSQEAYVQTLQNTGSVAIQSQFMSLSVFGKGSSGTFTVQISGMTAQTLDAGTVYSLPYVGKPYSQGVTVDGGGSVTVEYTVIY